MAPQMTGEVEPIKILGVAGPRYRFLNERRYKNMRTSISLVIGVLLLLSVSGCSEKKEGDGRQGYVQKEEKKADEKKIRGIAEVCNYFPKELVESAIGKPIVKSEELLTSSDVCLYYTAYSKTYHHTPYGDKPGGPHIVVVYDTKDFAKDKVTNEKHGSVYTGDPSIGMDNYVVRNRADKIWLTALALGDEKYIRFKSIDNAVTGDDLVKIARKFAEKIKRGK
jgi:hypothetical protein